MNNIDKLTNKLNIRVQEKENELIKLYGEKYKKYRENFTRAGNFEYEPEFPLYIMPEQTYKCNLSCVSCVHGYKEIDSKYMFKPAVMPLETYKRIVDEAKEHNCPSIATHNNDEPLLVKDLEERISYARKTGFMDVIMTTNATLFTKKRIEKVIDAGVTKMLFSIDALSEEAYYKVREGGNFKKAVESLMYALEYREKKNLILPFIRVSFVVNSHNRHELEDFVKHYSEIVDYIDIQPLFMSHTNAGKELIPHDAVNVQNFRCNANWRTVIIRGNGDVLPCPNFSGVDILLGNIHKNSIYDIYNGTKAKQMRQDGRTGNYTFDACKVCSKSIYKLPDK